MFRRSGVEFTDSNTAKAFASETLFLNPLHQMRHSLGERSRLLPV
jgi:hypothetical protein